MDTQLTALRHVMDSGAEAIHEKDARQVLGGLGLHCHTVSDVPLVTLSGGQKVRVALAKLLWPPPQLLVLDEVTTHLDVDTILGLVLALRKYDGAILVVTHDRFFRKVSRQDVTPLHDVRHLRAVQRRTPQDTYNRVLLLTTPQTPPWKGSRRTR
jgi:ATP-binding cassette subfamily F protein 3